MSTQTATAEYISVTETAKLLRAALKEAFPGEKFSVRSSKYAGGASIYVTYTNDNLDIKEIERVASQFQGASFDGMTDSKSYHASTLDGRTVRFGADFVFVRHHVPVCPCGRQYC